MEVTERIAAGEFTWAGDFKNLHPSPFGQDLYHASMKRMLEFKIDDGPWQKQDLFTRWSRQQHLPWLYLLAPEIPAGAHKLFIRTTDQKNPQSEGHACRIFHFAVNE